MNTIFMICGGHRVIEPRDDALIDLKPSDIMPHHLRVGRAVNVVDDVKLAECGVEEGAPHAEVVLG
jgi:hypothetical protein